MDLDHGLDEAWIPARQVRDDLGGETRTRVSETHATSAWSPEYQMPPVVLIEQRLQPAVKYAAWVPVSREVLADQPMVTAVVQGAVDRWLRPWLYPDRCLIPTLDLFPRLSRFARRCRRRG